MGLMNRLLSIVNDAKEKVEEVRDKKLEEIENAKLKETWYVSKTDQFNYVRVICLAGGIEETVYYRTIANITAIERDNTRVQMPNESFIDCTHYAHNREALVESLFRQRFSRVGGFTLIHDLEERYQEVVSGWKERLEQHKTTLGITEDEAESQRRLNSFLHPTSGSETSDRQHPVIDADFEVVDEVENVDHNNYNLSGSTIVNGIDYDKYNSEAEQHNRAVAEERGEIYVAPVRNRNPYGGFAEIPKSLMPETPITAEQIKQINKMAQKEKLPEPKKRLESIE